MVEVNMMDSLKLRGELFLDPYIVVLLFIYSLNLKTDIFRDSNCIARGK